MVMDSIIISPLLLLLYVTTVRVLDIAIFWIEMFFVKHNSTRTQRQTSRAEACMQCRVLEEMNQSCRASVERDRGRDCCVGMYLLVRYKYYFLVSAYRMPALRSFIRKLSPRKRNKLIYPTELHLYILSWEDTPCIRLVCILGKGYLYWRLFE